MKERLQKLMAQGNLGSRRACELLIDAGRVRVNGRVAKLGDQADPAVDVIEVDDRRLIVEAQRKVYIAVNKPRNVVTTNVGHKHDARRTVRDLVPIKGHLFTIGRLDAESEGLIILTNDGELANKLSHPRYQHTKTYKVSVNGLPSAETIIRWENGVMLEDEGMTAPCSVQIVRGAQDVSILRIVMTEGKKRQIRRVGMALGHQVRRLMRTRIGLFDMGPMVPGEWRELTPEEVTAMSTPSPELKRIRQRAQQAKRRRPEDAPAEERSAPAAAPRPTRKPFGGPRPARKPGDDQRPAARPKRNRPGPPGRRDSGRPPSRRTGGGKRSSGGGGKRGS